ncbi:MAG TPA: PQQ-binding-like beta-propeller repeat protein [Gemmataceae bacterium]|nr:PQQ-binding-like beta-propeller repeat protein [Gemmataceae bacterium]
MTNATRTMGVLVGAGILLNMSCLYAQDWPQWLGPHRDAKASGFQAPKTWPKELTQKWKISIGDGVATPALVGDKLYVFSRQQGSEILRCLDAATGKEQWQDKYESGGVTGAASGFSGPRSSPIVADGKIVTLGVRGILSCYDAATGKKLWRKDDFQGSWPRFFVSSSPVVVDGLCIAQLGGQRNGTIVAYNLANGEQKWKWSGDAPAYASPELMTVGDTKVLVAEMEKSIVALNATDGKLLWQTPFAVRGRGYNASTPMVDKQTILYSGSSRGTTAVKIEKQGDSLAAKELWKNQEVSVQFNTPVIYEDKIFGISAQDSLFCLKASDGKTAWTASLQGGGGGGRGSRPGYGSIVVAGPVLFALNPSAQLVVFEPSDKSFKQLAKYKVGERDTYAYPVVAGNRVYVKDRDSLILWTIE